MKFQLGFLVLLFALISSSGYAMNMDVLEGREDAHEPMWFYMPYAFYNETTDTAVAAAVVAAGYIQPQMAIVANFFTVRTDRQNPLQLNKFTDILYN